MVDCGPAEQYACTLFTPEMCSALRNRKSVHPEAYLVGLLHEGPGTDTPLAVDVGLGSHVVRQYEDMPAGDCVLEPTESQ